jgi:hypothetical protein
VQVKVRSRANAAHARSETRSHRGARARFAIGRGVRGTTHGRSRATATAGLAPRVGVLVCRICTPSNGDVPALQARRLEDGVLIDLPLGSRSLYLLLRSHSPLRCYARAALLTNATWPSTRKEEPPSSHHTLGGTSGASSEALAGSSHRQIERAAGPDAAVIDASVRRQLVATVG